MIATLISRRRWQASYRNRLRRIRPSVTLFTLLILFPALALAQSPFDTGFTAMQTLFTGTVAKVASLIAIVVGGYQFAHGEPGAKKVAYLASGLLSRQRPQGLQPGCAERDLPCRRNAFRKALDISRCSLGRRGIQRRNRARRYSSHRRWPRDHSAGASSLRHGQANRSGNCRQRRPSTPRCG